MKTLKLIQSDPYLQPFAEAINGRYHYAVNREKELTNGAKLSDWANGHMFYGLHKVNKQWVIREWAPNATKIYVIGEFNNWQEDEAYAMKRLPKSGNWEIKLPAKAMKHGDLYKLKVYWEGGCGERIPAWVRRVVQDEQTKIFSAQVWEPEHKYEWKNSKFKPNTSPLLIYECHIGMGQDAEKAVSYTHLTLPTILLV